MTINFIGKRLKKEIEPIIDQLTKSGEEFKRKLLSILNKYKTIDRIEFAKLVSQIDFWKGLDLETQIKLNLNDLFTQYDKQISELLLYADSQKIRHTLAINSNLFESMKYYRGKELLGRAELFSDVLKNSLLNSIINGTPIEQIKEDLAKSTLTSGQMNVAISTGYNDYGRTLINLSYKDFPDQRFLYFGTIIPTASKQCTWLLMNQSLKKSEEGYTKKEIEKGIKTPYGIINWNGRIPNFNCDDRWYPVTDYLIKSIKAFQIANADLARQVLEK